MMPKVLLASLVFLSVLSAGCATMVSGTKQRIKINTQPQGATVVIEETWDRKVSMTLTTPAEVQLPRKYSYHVTVDKKGYYPARRGIGRKPNKAVAGDLVILPIHWWGTLMGLVLGGADHFTGAIWTLSPSEINIELKVAEEVNKEK
ncbi:MAG: PEGA domain-containing protein [Planctomycetes bacterium]|nr:PEGA domain-containing protein [Planctomycetota bacterium]